MDATLFGRFSDINGNDSVNFYNLAKANSPRNGGGTPLAYDLQRSVLDAPVFNTENHIILDRETRYVPASHIRSALWQEAIHGQCASAIWVWERSLDPKSDLAGNIMNRPACTEAVGLVNCDLNRAALEVTALQRARPQVLLLQSCTAAVWDAARNDDCHGQALHGNQFCRPEGGLRHRTPIGRADWFRTPPYCWFPTSSISPTPRWPFCGSSGGVWFSWARRTY